MSANSQPTSNQISGFVKSGFEPVREAFIENFTRRKEVGAACCIYYQGEKVVDLWGGIRNKATGEPWEEDTMVLVHSTTKGLSAMALALLHSRSLLDYEERVSTYWPEFTQQGKEKVTVRQLLGHQAGLAVLDAPVDRAIVADLDRLAAVIAAQKPAWEPGTRQGYHFITLGFYEGELLRRVDPRHRSLGQFFQDEIAAPLGLDFYICLPEDIPNSQLATFYRASMVEMIIKSKPGIALAMFNPGSLARRSMFKNPGVALPFDPPRIYSRNLEVPSQGGVGTARAIARAYSVFATGEAELQLRQETLQALMAPAIPPRHGFEDVCLKREWQLSLGFAKPSSGFPYAHPSAFGTPGAGGSFGFADPQHEIGYAYVLNQGGAVQGGDPRDVALREALYWSIGCPNPFQPDHEKIADHKDQYEKVNP
jgi:CubicO group peptidase (beta-lactamase class C family)